MIHMMQWLTGYLYKGHKRSKIDIFIFKALESLNFAHVVLFEVLNRTE